MPKKLIHAKFHWNRRKNVDFGYFMVFNFTRANLGVVLLTTFLVFCPNVDLLWWKIVWSLETAISCSLRHLNWHPLPKRPNFKMAFFLVMTPKFFFAKNLLILQVLIMESYTKMHWKNKSKPWIFDFFSWTPVVWPFLFLVPKITCFCSQEPAKWLEWLKTL